MNRDHERGDRRSLVKRRGLLQLTVGLAGGLFFAGALMRTTRAAAAPGPSPGPRGPEPYDWTQYYWAYAVDTTKCIGCGTCVRACRRENDVPAGCHRTWVERYEIDDKGEVHVDVGADDTAAFDANAISGGAEPTKAFFVPKLCNHCERSVCSQVCPVGASYATPDGVVLVDKERCIGCGYCIQACPYGTRFINPRTHTADKCTFCYHRITKGLKPACVHVCPVGARMFGNLKDHRSELREILRQRRYSLLKPEMGTRPKCYYIGLDLEVK
jgi:tetrathionate reductase subunit B